MYLCFLPGNAGLVFAEELPDGYYSPGIFVIEEEDGGVLPSSFSFRAVQNGEEQAFTLIRSQFGGQNENLYVVETESFGGFRFLLESLGPEIGYQGRSSRLRRHRPLRICISLSAEKMEQVCQDSDFYFVGVGLE